MGNIAGTYAAGTLTLTSLNATATLAEWQAALASVTYRDTAASPVTTTRTISFTINDGTITSTVSTKAIAFTAAVVPTLTWMTPPAITYGTALSVTQLDAVAKIGGTVIPGAYVYSSPAGTVLTAGTATLNVTFTPTDLADYAEATGSVSLTVNPATPVLTWATPGAIVYGTALSATQLNATSAGVAGPLVYTPGVGSIPTVGSVTLSVTFTPTDAVDYTTATTTVSLAVSQATPGLTWATPGSVAYGTLLTGSQLDAVASVPGTIVYSPALGAAAGLGNQTLSATFTPTDTVDYASTSTTVTLLGHQATPVITWATPAAVPAETALSATQLNATASVAGTFV
jgi:hypothetical protein